MEKVSILIPCYNAEKTIRKTLLSCIEQNYPYIEILVSDNYSQDKTPKILDNWSFMYPRITYYKNTKNIGGIENMNSLLDLATGDYLVMLCADDYFTSPFVISDMVRIFQHYPSVGFIGRYYYQFLDGHKEPFRAFRSNNPYRSADQWSGLGFRKTDAKLSHNIFVETVDMVKQVLDKKWNYYIMEYDTVAVRSTLGSNGSQNPDCYIQSPLKNWIDLIGKEYSITTSFISLIQIKNWGTYKALLREIWYFIKYRPLNLLRIDFWFFTLLTLFTPIFILKELVNCYKLRIGKYFVKIKEKPNMYFERFIDMRKTKR